MITCNRSCACSFNEYFNRMVSDDINLIIRELHKSTPQTTIADELKENLEAVENFKGNHLEKQAMLYCKQLGINYEDLSDEEFRQLIQILQKAKRTGTPINQTKTMTRKITVTKFSFTPCNSDSNYKYLIFLNTKDVVI